MKAFVPLNPSDQVLLVMDREISASGLPGAWCAFALEMAGRPDPERFQTGLKALAEAFPILSARLVKRGRLYGWQPTGLAIPVYHRSCPADQSTTDFWHRQFQTLMNREPDTFSPAPLCFHVLEGGQRTLLVAKWLHPLMDAGGIKRLFDFIMADEAQRSKYLGSEEPLVSRKLASWSWKRRLSLMWRGKRHNDRIDRLRSSLPCSVKDTLQAKRLHSVHLTLSKEETDTVLKTLRLRVGLGGQSLYFIGCLMRALEAMGPEVRQDAWCIPYAFNLRAGNAPVPVTGNQVSVLFAQAPHAKTVHRHTLFEHLRQQHEETVRQELDMAYLPLMWLGSWLSLPRYGQILRQQKYGGERSSAWFSDIGELRFHRADFLGASIEGIRHACFTTAPPSLAVLFCRFAGRLNISTNYLLPGLSAEWIDRFQRHLYHELLAG